MGSAFSPVRIVNHNLPNREPLVGLVFVSNAHAGPLLLVPCPCAFAQGAFLQISTESYWGEHFWGDIQKHFPQQPRDAEQWLALLWEPCSGYEPKHRVGVLLKTFESRTIVYIPMPRRFRPFGLVLSDGW